MMWMWSSSRGIRAHWELVCSDSTAYCYAGAGSCCSTKGHLLPKRLHLHSVAVVAVCACSQALGLVALVCSLYIERVRRRCNALLEVVIGVDHSFLCA